MAGPVFPHMHDTRLAIRCLGRNRFENRLETLPRLIAATRHHRWSKQCAFLAAGDTHAHEMKTLGAQFPLTANGVFEIGIATVDDDVARLHIFGKLVDHRIGGRSCLDHDDGGAGTFEQIDELLDGLRRVERALVAILLHELLGTGIMPVVDGHGIAMTGQITSQARPHGSKSHDTHICRCTHKCMPPVFDCVPSPSLAHILPNAHASSLHCACIHGMHCVVGEIARPKASRQFEPHDLERPMPDH